MIAYTFLGDAHSELFSGRVWPEEGVWVQSATAHLGEQLLPLLDTELWAVELEDVSPLTDRLVGARGRLVRRVATWDDEAATDMVSDCVARARENSDALLRSVGLADDADTLGELDGAAYAEAAARVATTAPAAAVDATFFAADAATLARGRRPEEYEEATLPVISVAAAAANVAFVVAHAVAMTDAEGYDRGFAGERERQLEWLERRLGEPLGAGALVS